MTDIQDLWREEKRSWQSLLRAFQLQDQGLVNAASKARERPLKKLQEYYGSNFIEVWDKHCQENKAKRKDPHNIYCDLDAL